MSGRSADVAGAPASLTLADLRTQVQSNPCAVAQVQEFSQLATVYQRQSYHLEALERRLATMSPDTLIPLRDLFVEHSVCDRQRLRLLLNDPIKRAIENFVSTLYATVEQLSRCEHTSAKTNRNGVVAHQVIQECAGALLNACTNAVIFENFASIDDANTRTVNDLSNIWTAHCYLMIENERRALLIELPHLKRLAAVIMQAVQMVNNKKDAESTFNTTKSQFAKVSHIFHRVMNDGWFGASRVKSFGLLLNKFNASATEKQAFFEWVKKYGNTFYQQLLRDCVNVERIIREPPHSVVWHGVQVLSEVDDTVDVAAVLAPSYLKTFANESGRVYIKNIQQSRRSQENFTIPFRTLPCVKTMFVLNALLERRWLPIHLFSTSFVITVIHTESILYSSKTVDISEHLSDICTQSGHSISAQEVAELIARDACSCALYSDSDTTDSVSSLVMSCTDTRDVVVQSGVISHGVQTMTTTLYEYICPPLAIDNNAFTTRLLHVHSYSILDYAVICSIARLVWSKIDRSRLAGTSEDLTIPSCVLMQMSIDVLQHDADLMPHSIRSAISNNAALTQQFSHVVRKLVATGKQGCAVADKANVTARALVWDVSFCAWHGALALKVGRGTRDPVSTTLVELCLRIKAHLDQAWPLPVGIVWGISIPRRGRK